MLIYAPAQREGDHSRAHTPSWTVLSQTFLELKFYVDVREKAQSSGGALCHQTRDETFHGESASWL